MNSQKKPIIKLSQSTISDLEKEYVNSALHQNELSYHGVFINDVETYFEAYFKGKKVIALNSGTSAIHLALIMAGVQKEDSVLCQSFTYAATAFPITYLGAKPIFIDSELKSWNMCPSTLEEAIKGQIEVGKKPKAIVIVHSYGMPCRVEEISRVASQYNIPLIEDAAEALGSEVNGKKCGTFGDFGIISFNTNKIITSSGGGLLICNSEDEKSKIVHLATQAKGHKNYYFHEFIGYNYRMNSINAAILKAQLTDLENRIYLKREIHSFYDQVFKGHESIQLQHEYCQGIKSNFWLNCILIQKEELLMRLKKKMDEENIEVRSFWKPMHTQPVFRKCKFYGSAISENLFKKGLCLPSGASLTEKDLKRIEDSLTSCLI